MLDKVRSEEPFLLKCCLDRHYFEVMCAKAVDACLLALKAAPDLFITNKMLEKLDNVLFFDDDIDFDDLDSDIVTFLMDIMGLLTVGIRGGINTYSMRSNKSVWINISQKIKSCGLIKLMHKRLAELRHFSSFCSLSWK